MDNEIFGEVEQRLKPQETAEEIAEMRKRMQQKAADIGEMQATLFGDDAMGASQGDTQMGNSKGVEEVEPLSVFVGNVDYACTVDEVHQHFDGCGTVNRVTILSDKFGQPKGFAYVEFVDEDAVEEALRLNESELHGRKLKVMRKRKNVPGMRQRRPRHFNPYVAYGYEPSVPPYFYSPYGVYGFRKPQ